jgi:hypothetical protein
MFEGTIALLPIDVVVVGKDLAVWYSQIPSQRQGAIYVLIRYLSHFLCHGTGNDCASLMQTYRRRSCLLEVSKSYYYFYSIFRRKEMASY